MPSKIDVSVPTQREYAHFLIVRFLEANGLGKASEMTYLLKNTKTLLIDYLNEMHLSGELLQVKVGDNTYYALPKSLELLN